MESVVSLSTCARALDALTSSSLLGHAKPPIGERVDLAIVTCMVHTAAHIAAAAAAAAATQRSRHPLCR
jgi:hypothetical protein